MSGIGICPSVDELQRILSGQVGAADEARLDAHVNGCTSCQDKLASLTEGSRTVLAVPANYNRLSQPKTPYSNLLRRIASNNSASSPSLSKNSLFARAKIEQPASESSTKKSSGFHCSSAARATGGFLRRQIWTWPLFAALILGGAGWWINRIIEGAMRDQRIHDLAAVLDADVAALRIWMNSQRSTAELVASERSLQPFVLQSIELAPANGNRDRLRKAPLQTALREHLAGPLKRSEFVGFILVAPSGQVLANDSDAPVGDLLTGYPLDYFRSVVAGQAAVSKPFRASMLLADETGKLRAELPCMYAAAAVRDSAGNPIAALGLRIRPEDQFTRILRVARSGASGETYAFDRSGLMLSQSRFDEDLKQMGLLVDQSDSRSILTIEVRDPGVNMAEGARPTQRRADQPLTRMAQDAVLGRTGFDVDGYRDYRGMPVVGSWVWLNEFDFGVATEIDVAEAFRPLHLLRLAFGAMMALLLLGAAGIMASSLLIARQHRALNQATRASTKLGQYTLVEKLGSGGMGTVYKARHALLRRPTAVKLLNPDIVSRSSLARFEREVQLTSELTHPHTVMIFDYGHTPDGVFYYAMELLVGINLNDLVTQYGALPEARLVHILRQTCQSLAEAHAAGLVHRDIKPANIVLTNRGGTYDFVKVIDFGLVKGLDNGNSAHATAPDSLAGTPHYLSPESFQQPADVDARTDVYALGAVGYFLLTGSAVFEGASALEICRKHAWETPITPTERIGKPVSPELEKVLLSCLAKSQDDRPADAADLLHKLESCVVSGRWTSTDAAEWWAANRPVQQTTPEVHP